MRRAGHEPDWIAPRRWSAIGERRGSSKLLPSGRDARQDSGGAVPPARECLGSLAPARRGISWWRGNGAVYHPRMPSLMPGNPRWRGKRPICKTSHRHRDRVRLSLRLPEDAGAAVRTEMERHSVATVGQAPVSLGGALGPHRRSREECGNAVSAAGPPLAVEAMAQCDQSRLAVTGDLQLPAGTGCGSHGLPRG